jgi:ferredoxin
MNASVNHDVILTVDEKADLAKGQDQGSLYCQGCQQCVKNCPKRLPIPDIMRAYMYTYGYRDNEQAYSLLKSLELPENPCKDCTTCTAICKKHFVVSERIADVMRLTSIPEEFIS